MIFIIIKIVNKGIFNIQYSWCCQLQDESLMMWLSFINKYWKQKYSLTLSSTAIWVRYHKVRKIFGQLFQTIAIRKSIERLNTIIRIKFSAAASQFSLKWIRPISDWRWDHFIWPVHGHGKLVTNSELRIVNEYIGNK